LPLFDRELRISRLSDCGEKYIQAARIDPLVLDAAQLSIHSLGAATPKLRYRLHTQQFEIFQHRGPD
jgi:hypothetical protein